MPKSKKRKTTHHSQPQNQSGDLSHAEIWDDSALLRSWNDALAEYDFYHSIHARGEDVEEVLRKAEMDESDMNEKIDVQRLGNGDVKAFYAIKGDENVDDGEIDESEGKVLEDGEKDEIVTSNPVAEQDVGILDAPASTSEAAEPLKAATSTLTSDQLLEKIKMSYYWAGYYSGLYDAQRQAEAQPQ